MKKRIKSWLYPLLAVAIIVTVAIVVINRTGSNSVTDVDGDVVDGRVVIKF